MNMMIVGGGKVGAYLAGLLLTDGHSVKLVEAQAGEMQRLGHELPQSVLVPGDGTDAALLETAGIRTMDVVAAVTGADETNLVITSLARFEFGVRCTVARINNPRNAWMFIPEMGVDVALNQADVMAHLVANLLASR